MIKLCEAIRKMKPGDIFKEHPSTARYIMDEGNDLKYYTEERKTVPFSAYYLEKEGEIIRQEPKTAYQIAFDLLSRGVHFTNQIIDSMEPLALSKEDATKLALNTRFAYGDIISIFGISESNADVWSSEEYKHQSHFSEEIVSNSGEINLWTTEKPTETGWFWFRCESNHRIVEIKNRFPDGALVVLLAGSDLETPLSNFDNDLEWRKVEEAN